MKGKTTAIAGPSGVGKSSLINGLTPEANMDPFSLHHNQKTIQEVVMGHWTNHGEYHQSLIDIRDRAFWSVRGRRSRFRDRTTTIHPRSRDAYAGEDCERNCRILLRTCSRIPARIAFCASASACPMTLGTVFFSAPLLTFITICVSSVAFACAAGGKPGTKTA